MKFYAMVNKRGAASAETCLCNICYGDLNNRVAAVRQAHIDTDIAQGFHDVSANTAMTCVKCGVRHPQQSNDPYTRLLNDLNSLSVKEKRHGS